MHIFHVSSIQMHINYKVSPKNMFFPFAILFVSKNISQEHIFQALSGKHTAEVRKEEKGQSVNSGEGSEEEEREGEKEEEREEEKEEVAEASTVVNYSKEEVKELLRKKTEVEVGKVILVNYRPAVLKKRKVKVGKSKQRRRYTNRRRKSNISQA